MSGLNDGIDEEFPVYSEDTDQATKLPGYVDQPLNNPDIKSAPAKFKILSKGSIMGYLDEDKDVAPPTAEQLFSRDIIKNELPNFNSKFIISKKERDCADDLFTFSNSVAAKHCMCQEDAQVIDQIAGKGQFLTDDNPIGFFTKSESRTRYTESMKKISQLIDEKIKNMTENFAAYTTSLIEEQTKFLSHFADYSKRIDLMEKNLLVMKEDVANYFQDDKIKFLFNQEQKVQDLLNGATNITIIENWSDESEVVTAYKDFAFAVQAGRFKSYFMDFYGKRRIMHFYEFMPIPGDIEITPMQALELANVSHEYIVPKINSSLTNNIQAVKNLKEKFFSLENNPKVKIDFMHEIEFDLSAAEKNLYVINDFAYEYLQLLKATYVLFNVIKTKIVTTMNIDVSQL